MPAPLYRTLGDLRQTLRIRLGFGASGAAQGANNELLNSFLQDAQNEIYDLADWKHLHLYKDSNLGAGQQLIDVPAEINPQRLVAPADARSPIWVLESNRWLQLTEGINAAMYDTISTSPSYPTRYERYAQIQLWPQNDTLRPIRFWGIAPLARFTQDNDRCTIDDALVFLHALAHAKVHYKQDGAIYMSQWERKKAFIIGRQIGQHGVISRGTKPDPIPKPVVV